MPVCYSYNLIFIMFLFICYLRYYFKFMIIIFSIFSDMIFLISFICTLSNLLLFSLPYTILSFITSYRIEILVFAFLCLTSYPLKHFISFLSFVLNTIFLIFHLFFFIFYIYFFIYLRIVF